jgi:histidinol-phosphatase
MADDKLLAVAKDAIDGSQKVIVDFYNKSEILVSIKDDNSPVTQADKTAEKIIVEVIRKTFPDHNFIGEEAKYEKTDSAYTWIIDPIDGTRFFMRKIPKFCTLLALKKGDELVMGFIHNPINKESIYAVKGNGVFVNDKKVSYQPSISSLDQAYINTPSIKYFMRKKILDKHLKMVETTQFSTSQSNGMVPFSFLEGKIDIIIEPWGHFWDFAATALIVSEAGGAVSDLNGNPIDENSESLIASPKLLHDEVLSFYR